MISDGFTIQIGKDHFGFFLWNTRRVILNFGIRVFAVNFFMILFELTISEQMCSLVGSTLGIKVLIPTVANLN